MVMPDATTPPSTPPLPTTLAECHAVIIEQSTVIAQLREIIAQQQATIDEQQALLQSMQRDMSLMKRALFGQRRERFDDPRQGLLFDAVVVGGTPQDGVSGEDDVIASAEANDDGEDDDEAQSSTQRTGRRRRVIPESLPRVRRIHELNESEIPEHLHDVIRLSRLPRVDREQAPPHSLLTSRARSCQTLTSATNC